MDWKTIKVRGPLFEKVKRSVAEQSDPTITNTSHFIDLAIREKLERQGVTQK